MRRAAKAVLAVALLGCGGPAAEADAERATAADTALTQPREPVDAVTPGSSWGPPGDAGGTAADSPPPMPRAEGTPGAPAPEAATGGWTVGRIERPIEDRPGAGLAVLRDARTGRQADSDRVVFEFGDARIPGYRIEYVDSPQRQCGSGHEVRLPGEAWLMVDLEPAQAHDEEGRATVAGRTQRPGLPNLLELRLICDFEGQVTWVLGLRSPQPFRVLRLERPARLVLDVRH